MIKKIHNHLGYYIFLGLILGFGFVLTSLSSPNRQLQVSIIVLTTVFYVAFGILHHLLNHDLNPRVVVEYILIGSFGLVLVLFLMKGGLGI